MNGLWRRIVNLLIVSTLVLSVLTVAPGCRRKGPAERTGEKVDEAVEDVGEAVEDAGDDVQDAAK